MHRLLNMSKARNLSQNATTDFPTLSYISSGKTPTPAPPPPPPALDGTSTAIAYLKHTLTANKLAFFASIMVIR